jgi:hypothetical protein
MRKEWSFLWFLLLLLSVRPGYAQAKFVTQLSENEIGKNDYVEVQFVVQNASSVESITPPAFTGFKVVSGPMQQSGMSVVNGAVSKSEGISYVLKPNAPGTYTIAGASALVDGKPMRSNSVRVVVNNSTSTHPSTPANPLFGFNAPEEEPVVDEEFALRKNESAAAHIKDNLFVKLDVSKTTCYTGEPIVATYKLYSRLRSESRITKRPSLANFSVYDMIQPDVQGPSREVLKGKAYNVHVVRKVQLYPLQDGSFELEPMEVDNTVGFLRLEEDNSRYSMQQLVDAYMNGLIGGHQEDQKVTLSSKPVTITVKPLPAEGRPAGFDGAVGKFSIRADVLEKELFTNETGNLQIVLEGDGNIPLINAPSVSWPATVEGFDPAVKENADHTVAPIHGNKIFTYSFSVQNPGVISIPPVSFSYFDPAANVYKTIQTDAILLNVKKGKTKPASKPGAAATQETSRDKWWYAGAAALFVLVVLVAFFLLKRKKPAKPVEPLVQETMPVIPEKTDWLAPARSALAAGESQSFYRYTEKALWNFLAEHLSLTASQLNKTEVRRVLQLRNMDPLSLALFEEVMNDCQLALYTPNHTEQDMRTTLSKAEQLIAALER